MRERSTSRKLREMRIGFLGSVRFSPADGDVVYVLQHLGNGAAGDVSGTA